MSGLLKHEFHSLQNGWPLVACSRDGPRAESSRLSATPQRSPQRWLNPLRSAFRVAGRSVRGPSFPSKAPGAQRSTLAQVCKAGNGRHPCTPKESFLVHSFSDLGCRTLRAEQTASGFFRPNEAFLEKGPMVAQYPAIPGDPLKPADRRLAVAQPPPVCNPEF